MLLKLPIIIENKVIFSLFKLKKYDSYYLLSPIENNNSEVVIKIILSNNISGYEFFNLYLPLKLFIIDNELLSFYFFMKTFCSTINNNFDFFYSLNNFVINKLKLRLIEKDSLTIKYNQIFDIIISEYIKLTNNKKYNKEFWEIINLLLNTTSYILWLNQLNITNINNTKKFNTYTNTLKNIKYNIDFSNDYLFIDHLINKNNNELQLKDLINNNNYYLLINNKKFLLVKVESIKNNNVKLYNFNDSIVFNKYKWYKYSPETKINENKIYFYLFFNNYTLFSLINKFNPKIEKSNINELISYFTENQIKSKLLLFILENNNNNEELTDFYIIKNNSYTSDFFMSVCKKYETKFISILDILFLNYTYPIKYNKKELDNVFDNILYLSLLNLNKILLSDKDKLYINQNITIPNKLKLLFFNILKTFHQIINNNSETVKYISDSLHVQFVKTLLFSNSLTLNLLKTMIAPNNLDTLKKKLLINFTIYDILKRLTWTNINKRLNNLKFLLNNKDHLYFFDKLNKNIFDDNFDTRIKNIIINPFTMFKYLRKECDFIKWTNFLENKYNDLYFNAISISSDDFNILGKIIFCLLNMKEQNLTDKHYKKLIYYGINYPKMIIENNRINLKIKENFGYLKCNINLGILAKHLVQNKDNYIEFDDNEKKEIDVLKQKIDIVTNKYLKYKKKYYNIKNNEQKI